MNDLLAILYLICFAVIAGGAFALMTQSLRGASQPLRPRPILRLRKLGSP